VIPFDCRFTNFVSSILGLWLKLLALVVILVSLAPSAFAQNGADRLQFRLIDMAGGGNCRDCGTDLLIYGVFDPDSPRRFKEIASKQQFSRILFHSPGGSVGAAIAIGEMIRQGEWRTHLQSEIKDYTDPRTQMRSDTARWLHANAECLSACAYAFLGGSQRTIDFPFKFGIHQFRSALPRIEDGSSQVTITQIGLYLDRMQVNRNLLDLASLTPAAEMRYLDKKLARRFNVITTESNGAWIIEATSTGRPYLKTNYQQRYGSWVRVAIYVEKGRPVLYVGTMLGKLTPRQISEFSDGDLSNIRLTANGVTYAENPIRPWKLEFANGQHIFSTEVVISPRVFRAIENAQSLRIDADFPNAWASLNPDGIVNTQGLAKGVRLISREFMR
jgi:hypothetical protein